MALSLESIHKPLNDFFLSQFGADPASTIQFRFDKFGSVLSDRDFMSLNHPEWGYVPSLAIEKFSDLVNHIPIDAGDGLNILLSMDSIDDMYYYHLLAPSLPVIPDGASEDKKQAIISNFNLVKAEAVRVWNNLTLQSSTGLMFQFKPSLATPDDWYNRTHNGPWTSHTFRVTTTTSSGSQPSSQLWRLRLDDQSMREVLQLHEREDLDQLDIAAHILELRTHPRPTPMPTTPVIPGHTIDPSIRVSGSLVLHSAYLRQFKEMDVSKRIIVSQYIGNDAPTQSVKTSSISISFDYCLVKIDRKWWVSAFTNDESWYVPGMLKGQVTSNNAEGKLNLIPIGFVAIRNLVIEADWSTEDIRIASSATDFGPFKVSGEIVNNKLSHPDLDIIGWLLEKPKDLPSSSDPAIATITTTPHA